MTVETGRYDLGDAFRAAEAGRRAGWARYYAEHELAEQYAETVAKLHQLIGAALVYVLAADELALDVTTRHEAQETRARAVAQLREGLAAANVHWVDGEWTPAAIESEVADLLRKLAR